MMMFLTWDPGIKITSGEKRGCQRLAKIFE